MVSRAALQLRKLLFWFKLLFKRIEGIHFPFYHKNRRLMLKLTSDEGTQLLNHYDSSCSGFGFAGKRHPLFLAC